MLKKITAFLILFILMFSIISNTYAASLSGLKDQKEEIQDEIDEAKEQYEYILEQKNAIITEIQKLANSIANNEKKIDEINTKLAKLEKEVDELEKKLEETEEKLKKQEDALKTKIVMDYKMGEVTYLSVLLNSNGILDFISNCYFITEIMKKDNELLDSIEEQKQKIETNKKEVEEKRKEVRTQKAEKEAVKVLLTSQKREKENKVSSLTSEEKKIQKEIEEYNNELRRVQKEIDKAMENAKDKYNGSISGSGVLAWPLPYKARITSYFGNREQPVPGASTNHKGIDIGVPVGTAVLSSADGYVVTTGYSSVRGYYMMVKHADNLYTFYQHLNSFKAKAGQNVKRGETIAYSGKSGIGSGPHLHYEVRTTSASSSAVNPLNYLDI